ncbi:hypothetical protein L249_2522, partial [Ophiocordyceps polyrhachis-furcata BCC 54312]
PNRYSYRRPRAWQNVGKVESNKVFCGAVEEEEGVEIIISNQGVDYYSASIAYSAPIDVQRADRCNNRCNESIRAL